MAPPPNQGSDRRRTLAVAEDAHRIARLAQELQRNALELEGLSISRELARAMQAT